MMLFSPSTGFFYNKLINNVIPRDVIEIPPDQYQNLMDGVAQGDSISVDEFNKPCRKPQENPLGAARTERAWRDNELKRADIELYKIQDSDQNSVGTVSNWRDYRKALRAYPEHQMFPNKEARPVAPDFKE